MVPIPGGSGKKEHKKARKRKRTEQFPRRDLSQYDDRLTSRIEGCSSDQAKPYELLFVKDSECSLGIVKGDCTTGPEKSRSGFQMHPRCFITHPFKSCTNLTAGDMRERKVIVADDV